MEARLIKPITPRGLEVMLLSTIECLSTHQRALIALFVASPDAHHPQAGAANKNYEMRILWTLIRGPHYVLESWRERSL